MSLKTPAYFPAELTLKAVQATRHAHRPNADGFFPVKPCLFVFVSSLQRCAGMLKNVCTIGNMNLASPQRKTISYRMRQRKDIFLKHERQHKREVQPFSVTGGSGTRYEVPLLVFRQSRFIFGATHWIRGCLVARIGQPPCRVCIITLRLQ